MVSKPQKSHLEKKYPKDEDAQATLDGAASLSISSTVPAPVIGPEALDVAMKKVVPVRPVGVEESMKHVWEPGNEVLEEAYRERDNILEDANKRAALIVERAQAKAAQERESTIKAAEEKMGEEKERLIAEVHKASKRFKEGRKTEVDVAAKKIFASVFHELG